ncbi:MAG: type II toxin-antitoxin system RelB/DinJ family antitoxin [Firmicutes bacterium]|jgi:DNA-damage-inducible protein J|nr:type II toxin-antitoxin system RelB/DinJ family antitoxin [Bacillota bacterium]
MTLSQSTTINVRVDESVKRNVEILFDSMGMNISTAVNVFFKQCLLEEALPFQPRAKRSSSLIEAIREAQEQAIKNETSNMTLSEINEIIAEVRQDKRGKQ